MVLLAFVMEIVGALYEFGVLMVIIFCGGYRSLVIHFVVVVGVVNLVFVWFLLVVVCVLGCVDVSS